MTSSNKCFGSDTSRATMSKGCLGPPEELEPEFHVKAYVFCTWCGKPFCRGCHKVCPHCGNKEVEICEGILQG